MYINSNDPLIGSGPDATFELFRRLGQECHGHSPEQVVGAACNLFLNAVRQGHGDRAKAFREFDEAVATLRGLLGEHYDNAGRRRNVFAFHQVIEVPHSDFRSKAS